MFRIQKGSELTEQQVIYFIKKHKTDLLRYNKLKNYYIGKQDILNRQITDTTKPNNKIVSPFANYITDTYVGYFMGEPTTYKADKGSEELLERIKDIFNYNDEQEENAELAKNASIYGTAYELLYLDTDAQIRFKALNTEDVIVVFDDTVEDNLEYAIRVYVDTTTAAESVYSNDRVDRYIVEIYSKDNIATYKFEGNSLTLVDVVEHQFKEVPIVLFQNNSEELGDFETVISLIDAYDKLNSDSLNDFEAFVDCYLVLKGMEGTELADIQEMKEKRVMLLPTDGASAEWLTKNQPDTHIENLKNRIENNIHKFSKVPNMSDESFANNASGVAIKYKLMGMENATSKKERKFKKGLQRRIELITNIFYILGTTYDYRAIIPVFKRNIPANIMETADMLTKIQGLISNETALGLLPFIEDATEEIKRKIEEDKISGYDIFVENKEGNTNEKLLEE